MTGKGNFDEMVSWLHNAISKLPGDAANVLVFNTLTGLLPFSDSARFKTQEVGEKRLDRLPYLLCPSRYRKEARVV